jgi:hypothetical protein
MAMAPLIAPLKFQQLLSGVWPPTISICTVRASLSTENHSGTVMGPLGATRAEEG